MNSLRETEDGRMHSKFSQTLSCLVDPSSDADKAVRLTLHSGLSMEGAVMNLHLGDQHCNSKIPQTLLPSG